MKTQSIIFDLDKLKMEQPYKVIGSGRKPERFESRHSAESYFNEQKGSCLFVYDNGITYNFIRYKYELL